MPEPDNFSSLITCLENENEGIEHSRALKPFQHAARWIPTAVGPFISIDKALYAGAAKVCGLELPSTTKEGDLSNFKLILKICPDLKRVLKGFNGDTDLLKCLISHLSAAASNARADDTSSCRKATASYITFAKLANPTELHIEKKSDRGWNNRHTARLLCPLKRLPEFDRDPNLFMRKVCDGTIKLSASQWPSFLYPNGTVHNQACIDKGLFHGPIMLQFLWNICTGPTSAYDGIRRASKQSKAEIHGMGHVFGRCVAYVAVQAYFSLSSVEQWSSSLQDGHFNLPDFFERCVGLFECNPTDPWVVETLNYLTSKLPSLKRTYKQKRKRNDQFDSGDDDSNSDEDETQAIYAQREARRLERIANEASSNRTQEESDASDSSISTGTSYSSKLIN